MAEKSEIEMKADEFMKERWGNLRDDYKGGISQAISAVEALQSVGVFTDEKAELWERRLKSCPGHDDSSRTWCAYCGDVPRPPEDAEPDVYECSCPAGSGASHPDPECPQNKEKKE